VPGFRSSPFRLPSCLDSSTLMPRRAGSNRPTAQSVWPVTGHRSPDCAHGRCEPWRAGVTLDPMDTDKQGTFAALAVPNFRRYVSGQSLSLIGTWMETVAQALLVLRLTHSGTVLGPDHRSAIRADPAAVPLCRADGRPPLQTTCAARHPGGARPGCGKLSSWHCYSAPLARRATRPGRRLSRRWSAGIWSGTP